jgi:hypothetical protein
MRRKARRVDKNDESGNRSRKEKGKTGIAKGATMNGRPSKFTSEETKKNSQFMYNVFYVV